MKKINKFLEKIEKDVYFVALVISILGLCYSFYMFFNGFHNTDLVFNDQYILSYSGRTIDEVVDQYDSKGNSIELRDLYVVGWEQIFQGFFMSIVSSLFLGITLEYFYKIKKQIK